MPAFNNLILVYVVQKQYDQALERCRNQLPLAGDVPHQAVIYSAMGGVYMTLQDMQNAEVHFKKAMAADPNYMRSYYALARVYLVTDRDQEAIAQYEAALEKNPDQAGAHMLLGTIYDMQKQWDLSQKHYQEALSIDAEFVPAANNLAYLLAVQGKDLDKALELARRAKEKMPEDPAVMDTLGLVYYKKGLYDNAMQELAESAEKLPDNPTVLYHLGLVHHKKGNAKEARANLEKALNLSQDFDGAEEARAVLAKL